MEMVRLGLMNQRGAYNGIAGQGGLGRRLQPSVGLYNPESERQIGKCESYE